MKELYYTPPSDECFEDMRECAIETWKEVSRDKFYLEEKVSRISKIQNIQDNFMYILAMFDSGNQIKVGRKLLPKTRQAINERLMSVDNVHLL